MEQGLLNPHTGKPFAAKKQPFTEDQLIQVLQTYRMKIDYLNQQCLQLGLYSEFIVQQLEAAGIKITLEEFPEFAEKRFAEIQEEITEMQEEKNAAIAAQANEAIEEQLEDLGVTLDE